MTYTVYILYSRRTDGYYIGYTSNVPRRLRQHNSGESRYTRGKGPWKVVYTESFQDKSTALKRERFLKAQRNREFYKSLIRSNK